MILSAHALKVLGPLGVDWRFREDPRERISATGLHASRRPELGNRTSVHRDGEPLSCLCTAQDVTDVVSQLTLWDRRHGTTVAEVLRSSADPDDLVAEQPRCEAAERLPGRLGALHEP